MRARLEDEVFSMLEHWIRRAQRDKNVLHMCVLRAHLAYLFKHSSDSKFDFKKVSTLLSAQVYLMSNYAFDADDHLSRKRKKPAKKSRKGEEKRSPNSTMEKELQDIQADERASGAQDTEVIKLSERVYLYG